MKGVSEKEFNSGDNVCKEIKCKRRGQPLEPAYVCEICDVLYPIDKIHQHIKNKT